VRRRLRLRILKGIGFDPVLNAKGRLEKILVRVSALLLSPCFARADWGPLSQGARPGSSTS
jgi:hypothetical protein